MAAMMRASTMTDILFEVQKDETAGGYIASARGYGIHTQSETVDELRVRVREAVDCFFDETMEPLARSGCAVSARNSSRDSHSGESPFASPARACFSEAA
jgi:hypothetical protein